MTRPTFPAVKEALAAYIEKNRRAPTAKELASATSWATQDIADLLFELWTKGEIHRSDANKTYRLKEGIPLDEPAYTTEMPQESPAKLPWPPPDADLIVEVDAIKAQGKPVMTVLLSRYNVTRGSIHPHISAARKRLAQIAVAEQIPVPTCSICNDAGTIGHEQCFCSCDRGQELYAKATAESGAHEPLPSHKAPEVPMYECLRCKDTGIEYGADSGPPCFCQAGEERRLQILTDEIVNEPTVEGGTTEMMPRPLSVEAPAARSAHGQGVDTLAGAESPTVRQDDSAGDNHPTAVARVLALMDEERNQAARMLQVAGNQITRLESENAKLQKLVDVAGGQLGRLSAFRFAVQTLVEEIPDPGLLQKVLKRLVAEERGAA